MPRADKTTSRTLIFMLIIGFFCLDAHGCLTTKIVFESHSSHLRPSLMFDNPANSPSYIILGQHLHTEPETSANVMTLYVEAGAIIMSRRETSSLEKTAYREAFDTFLVREADTIRSYRVDIFSLETTLSGAKGKIGAIGMELTKEDINFLASCNLAKILCNLKRLTKWIGYVEVEEKAEDLLLLMFGPVSLLLVKNSALLDGIELISIDSEKLKQKALQDYKMFIRAKEELKAMCDRDNIPPDIVRKWFEFIENMEDARENMDAKRGYELASDFVDKDTITKAGQVIKLCSSYLKSSLEDRDRYFATRIDSIAASMEKDILIIVGVDHVEGIKRELARIKRNKIDSIKFRYPDKKSL